jgi:hypothetical protein
VEHFPSRPVTHARGDQVFLLNLPIEIAAFFQEECLPRVKTGEAEERSSVLWDFANRALESLRSEAGVVAEEMYTHELMLNPPYLDSTSYDYEHERFIGLHIDTHQPLADRRDGFQLCGINVGRAERFFYFIDLGVEELFQKLGISGKEGEMPIKQLTETFLSRFPDTPVYRITLAPGEAYLAVTQNLIHDGASNQKGEEDASFFLAGYFACPSPLAVNLSNLQTTLRNLSH